MTLGDKRVLFTSCVHKLLGKMLSEGDQPMLGRDGLPHKKNSLHFDGLAVDIDLRDSKGVYRRDSEYHRKYGEFWESLHELCYWGGNGPKQDGLKDDGNHYSVTDMGRK